MNERLQAFELPLILESFIFNSKNYIFETFITEGVK